MSRERRIAALSLALTLGAAAVLYLLVFRATGLLWWESRIDRRIDPPAALKDPPPYGFHAPAGK